MGREKKIPNLWHSSAVKEVMKHNAAASYYLTVGRRTAGQNNEDKSNSELFKILPARSHRVFGRKCPFILVSTKKCFQSRSFGFKQLNFTAETGKKYIICTVYLWILYMLPSRIYCFGLWYLLCTQVQCITGEKCSVSKWLVLGTDL